VHTMNEVAKTCESKGMQALAWNDVMYHPHYEGKYHVTLKQSIIAAYWIGHGWSGQHAYVSTLIANGQNLINFSENSMYYVLSATAMWIPTPTYIYNDFKPDIFDHNPQVPPADRNHVLGASICIWCDYYTRETENTIFQGIYKPMKTVAQKMWSYDDPKIVYQDFLANQKLIGSAPLSDAVSPYLTPNNAFFGDTVIDTTVGEVDSGLYRQYFPDDMRINLDAATIALVNVPTDIAPFLTIQKPANTYQIWNLIIQSPTPTTEHISAGTYSFNMTFAYKNIGTLTKTIQLNVAE
jgi:hypothetical protein